MNDDLKFIFGNTNDWLRFAEAKNAGLLALNVGAIVGILQVDSIFSKEVKYVEGIMIGLFTLSACICVSVILPVLKKFPNFFKKHSAEFFIAKKTSLNVLYFGDISKLNPEQFIELLEHKFNITVSVSEKDLAMQIIRNSEICWQKYIGFSIAGWLTFSGLSTAVTLAVFKSPFL